MGKPALRGGVGRAPTAGWLHGTFASPPPLEKAPWRRCSLLTPPQPAAVRARGVLAAPSAVLCALWDPRSARRVGPPGGAKGRRARAWGAYSPHLQGCRVASTMGRCGPLREEGPRPRGGYGTERPGPRSIPRSVPCSAFRGPGFWNTRPEHAALSPGQWAGWQCPPRAVAVAPTVAPSAGAPHHGAAPPTSTAQLGNQLTRPLRSVAANQGPEHAGLSAAGGLWMWTWALPCRFRGAAGRGGGGGGGAPPVGILNCCSSCSSAGSPRC